MMQRLLTMLTCPSILLGMMLATCVLILEREGKSVFAQSDYGFDVLVGPKGSSPLQLVLNTIYHLGCLAGETSLLGLYEDMATEARVFSDDGKKNPLSRPRRSGPCRMRWGIVIRGRRIVATSPQLFGVDDAGKPPLPPDEVPHYRGNEAYTFAQGRAFAPDKFEAVIGSEVAEGAGLKVGSTFQATHGVPYSGFVPFDQHPEVWTVVGILNETHTANDRVLFIPLMTFYAIFEHEEGEEAISAIKAAATGGSATPPAAARPPPPATAPPPPEPEEKAYTMNADGTIQVKLPKKDWEISAVLVQTRGVEAMVHVPFVLRNMPDATAVSPAGEMIKFFDLFLPKVMLLLLIISTLVTIVAGVSILVSIYNSVTARNREIAIMRALGATRARILAAVCLEAGLVGVIGGILGILAGHLLAGAGSIFLQHLMGTGIAWWRFGSWEFLYFPVVVAVSLLAGLVPALKAYKTPVAENLV